MDQPQQGMQIRLDELYQLLGEKLVIIFKLEQQLKGAMNRIEGLEAELAVKLDEVRDGR